MPVLPTPDNIKGTWEEDTWSVSNKQGPLRYFSDLFDEMTLIVNNGSLIDGRHEIIEEDTAISIRDIKLMTKGSLEGKIFYIFTMPYVVPFSTVRVDADYVINGARIIICGGRRYIIDEEEKLEHTEVTDFNFIKIARDEARILVEKIQNLQDANA